MKPELKNKIEEKTKELIKSYKQGVKKTVVVGKNLLQMSKMQSQINERISLLGEFLYEQSKSNQECVAFLQDKEPIRKIIAEIDEMCREQGDAEFIVKKAKKRWPVK